MQVSSEACGETSSPEPPPSSGQHEVQSTLRGTRFDQQDIAILHNIILAFRHHLPLRLHGRFITQFLQHAEIVHHSLNESFLKVTVNYASSLRCFRPIPDRPLPYLIRPSGEERAEVERLAHGRDDLGQRVLGAEFLAFLFRLCLGLEASQTFLEGDGDRDDGVAGRMFLDPLGNFGEVLVLLSDVVLFAEVDEVDDGLGREEEEGVDDFDLSWQLALRARRQAVSGAYCAC